MTDEVSRDAPARRVPRVPLLVAAIVAICLIGWGAWGHYQRDQDAASTQEQTVNFVPMVRVAVAKREDGPVPFTLPGTISAFDQATLYARATGYVAERRVDIGSRVKKGDLLVRIASPDLDQQLAQAQAMVMQNQAALQQASAQVQQGRSSVDLAAVTNGRTSSLANLGWETKQDADNTRLGLAGQKSSLLAAQAAVQVAQANLAAQVANVNRLQQLTAYENVTAPFDGVITSRSVDTGDLVSDSNGTGNTLFTLVRDDVVRIQMSVPQSGAVGIQDGLEAKVHVPELPGQVFEGRVARSSVALVVASRTMQVEVDVPNKDGMLRPGTYVTVDIGITRSAPGIVVPAEAIVFNGQGLRVAEVKDDSTLAFHDVSIYRDFGTTVELRGGLQGNERVVLNPPAGLDNGAKVKLPDDAPPARGQQTAERS